MATWDEKRGQIKSIRADLGEPSHYLNEIWLQAKCKCEYCGIDLLESPQNFRGAESDHILPKAEYSNLEHRLSNYVMACSSCHKLKGRFDPAEDDEAAYSLKEDLTDAERSELINRVKQHLQPLRTKQQSAIDAIKTALEKHGIRP